jgi:mannose-1-phosphate guanylyltransferase
MKYAVIMAGGSGTRFWPKSTKALPKQCLPLNSDKPLIQETMERLYPIFKKENIYIATNGEIGRQLSEKYPETNFIIEPCAKNTTGCIGLACIELSKIDPEAIIFIETADHLYKDEEKYIEIVKKALALAEENKIVNIGIKPTHISTAYGYIKQGVPYKEGFIVEGFTEKPNHETAKQFVASGDYLWNSGMYVFKAKKMLEEIEAYQPEIYNHLMAIYKGRPKEIEFHKLENISIDYAIAERSKDLVMIRADMPWDDIGSWDSLARLHNKNEEGNIVIGKHIGIDSTDNIIYADSLITTIGLKNTIVVQTDKATLVCHKDRVEEVKDIVRKLKENKMEEYL